MDCEAFTPVTGVIVKPASNTCNIRCSYCYAKATVPLNSRLMSIKLAKKLVKAMFLQSNADRVEFIWHGGEPLLQDIEFYKEVFEYQNSIKPTQITISNAFQSNLTLMNKNWISFFKLNGIQLSTSLDGPEFIHDKHRVFRNGSGTHKITVRRIKEALNAGVSVNTITVVTEFSVNYFQEIYDHLMNLGIKHTSFLPCYVLNDEGIPIHPTISPGSFGVFMNHIFDIYFTSLAHPKVREFEQTFGFFLRNTVNVCNYNGSCHKFICLDSRGEVYSCDTSPASQEYQFGNLYENNLAQILSCDKRRDAIQRTDDSPTSCKSCKYWNGCHGGCPNQRPNGHYHFCADRKLIYKHVENRLANLSDEISIDTIR